MQPRIDLSTWMVLQGSTSIFSTGCCLLYSLLVFLDNLLNSLREDLDARGKVFLGDVQWWDEPNDFIHTRSQDKQSLLLATFRDLRG